MTEVPDNSSTAPQIFGGNTAPQRAHRHLGQSMWRGLKCRCPNCGEGRLFRAFMKPVKECEVCGEDYLPQRADDLPAYLTIVIVGHIVIAAVMYVEATTKLSLLQHLMIWTPLTLVSALVLMQPVKGAIVGLQWALYMHGFGGTEEGDA